jgi:hypothetical protein
MNAILLVSLFILTPQKVSPTHLYQNKECSYSFEYPNGWQIVKNPDYITKDCTVTLRPVDYEKRMAEDDVDLYTLTVQVSEGSFLQVAADHFDFDGEWMILGRQGMRGEAQVSNVNGWLILRGLAEAGCFHEKGGYAGLCDQHRIVAKHQTDDQIVAITADAQAEAPIAVILKTIKFLTH